MAFDSFLKIDSIPGESTAPGHTGEIEILSFSWGVSNPGSLAGGGGLGKATASDFAFFKLLDKTSPLLMLACCTGKHFPSVTLTGVTTAQGTPEKQYLVIKMEDCLVSSWQTSGSQGDGPTESISMNFGKIWFTEFPQSAAGGQPVMTNFDFRKQRGG